MKWTDRVIGQSAMLESFTSSVQSGTVSHAMIIEGPSGYGGLPIALALAEMILCDEPNKPCGVCRSCQQIQTIIHPDLHIAFPVVAKEGMVRKNVTSKDFIQEWRALVLDNPYLTYNEWIRSIVKTSANGDINVTECNTIIQQLNMQAYSGTKKVQIIWIADRLGSNGNKLLKLIEEPPEGTYIILIVDQLELLLKTIISRCRVIRLPAITQDAIAQRLVEQYEVDAGQAEQIGYISDGDFAQALGYIHLDQTNLMDLCLQWMNYCKEGDVYTLRQWSTEFNKYNLEEQKAILQYQLKVLRSILYAGVMGESAIKLSDTDKNMLLSSPLIRQIGQDQISKMSQIISDVIYKLERYVSGRMVMLDASLQINKLI